MANRGARAGAARLLLFDWDGTAVASRRDDVVALGLVARTEDLIRMGALLVIVTGTNFDVNIKLQYTDFVQPSLRRGIWACVNRGSQVVVFDEAGRDRYAYGEELYGPNGERLYVTRDAVAETGRSPDDLNDLLNATALDTKSELARRFGLDVEIVFNRLNRRKVDLIPQWRDPPKSQIAELFTAVTARLAQHGIIEGIPAVMGMVAARGASIGLPLKLTSDVKHVEFGLTDKSDSVNWVMRHVAAPRGITPADIVIFGDEFGPVGNLPGSDSYLVTEQVRGARVISVGAEPYGVPEGVVHHGGGPAGFLQLLDEQLSLVRAVSVR
jgi:hypothetical protein